VQRQAERCAASKYSRQSGRGRCSRHSRPEALTCDCREAGTSPQIWLPYNVLQAARCAWEQ